MSLATLCEDDPYREIEALTLKDLASDDRDAPDPDDLEGPEDPNDFIPPSFREQLGHQPDCSLADLLATDLTSNIIKITEGKCR
jgi:hypothetical protein